MNPRAASRQLGQERTGATTTPSTGTRVAPVAPIEQPIVDEVYVLAPAEERYSLAVVEEMYQEAYR